MGDLLSIQSCLLASAKTCQLSSWCLVMVERLFLAVPWGCLRFLIVVFPDHTHLLFINDLMGICKRSKEIKDL